MGNASRVTFQQILASLQRMPGLESISIGEKLDAIRTAAIDIGNLPWPWNYTETNVLVPAAHTEGTISITDGTQTVTGAGTSWPFGSTQQGWRIRFGTNNSDYIVSSMISATQLALAQPVNLGSNLSGSGYFLWKDTYFYPQDYILGSDVGMYLPPIRTRIQKIPRAKFEAAMNAGLRSFATNITQFYCNTGSATDQSAAAVGFQFRLGPPPSTTTELRLCYHRIANTFTTSIANPTDLPDGYDEVIELVAASKLYDLMKKRGESAEIKAIAEGKLKLLRRAVATDIIDDVPDPNIEVPNSSISQWGMTIQRMP